MTSLPTSEILQSIYHSEINFELKTFWATGFTWKLGDPFNGYHAEGNAETFDEAVHQLADATRRHFPHSPFAGEQQSINQPAIRTSKHCAACLEESGRPGPVVPANKPSLEFDLLIAARRKCPKCGADVFFERDMNTGQA